MSYKVILCFPPIFFMQFSCHVMALWVFLTIDSPSPQEFVHLLPRARQKSLCEKHVQVFTPGKGVLIFSLKMKNSFKCFNCFVKMKSLKIFCVYLIMLSISKFVKFTPFLYNNFSLLIASLIGF